VNYSLELVVGFELLYCFDHRELEGLSFSSGRELHTAAPVGLESVEAHLDCVIGWNHMSTALLLAGWVGVMAQAVGKMY